MMINRSVDRQFSDLRRRLNEFQTMFDEFSDVAPLPLTSPGFNAATNVPLLGSSMFPTTTGALTPYQQPTSTTIPNVDLPMDVFESDNEFTLKSDIPGMDKSNFNIRVTGDVLEIECHRQEEKTRGDANNRVRERRFGRAVRSMRLADNIDLQNIKSEYVDGVLSLHLPKTNPEPSNVKRIEIQ